MKPYLTFALAGVLCLLSGCAQKATQSKEAVQSGVLEYLKNRSGLDTSAMDITVNNVSFRDNEADATVSFSAKGSKEASNLMQMRYVLEQKDGKWVVKGRSGGSGGHGSEALPGAGGAHGGGGMGGGAELPPGHPPAGSKP